MSAANAGGNGQAPTQPNTPGSGNGPEPTTPSAHNGSAPQSGAPNGQAPAAIADFTPPSADEWKRIQAELAEARRDAAKYRTDLKAREDAALTAEQKRERDFTDLQTKALEYEATVQRLSLENAGLRLGAQLGIADVTAALALVQVEHAADVKYGSDGRPENLADLLKQVLKDHPALAASPTRQQPAGQAAQGASSGGAANPGRQAGNGGLTLEMIKAMPMRERMARMSEIQAWEKAQRQQAPQ